MTANESTWEIFNAVHKELDKANEPEQDKFTTKEYRKKYSHPGRPRSPGKNSPLRKQWEDERKPLPGEIRVMEWDRREAERTFRTPDSIRKRRLAGKYPELKTRRVNSHLIFVTP